FAPQPIGVKRADDGICALELIDIVPDRNHFSSAIGQRNAAVGARCFPLHHEIVTEIQRAGPDPDQQFTRPWFGMLFLDQVEIFQASRRSQPNQPHEYPLSPTAIGGAFHCRNTSSIRFCTFSYYW